MNPNNPNNKPKRTNEERYNPENNVDPDEFQTPGTNREPGKTLIEPVAQGEDSI